MSPQQDDGAWFAPKRYGYGTGLPIAWQGWALLIGFLAVIGALAVFLAPHHPVIYFPVALVLTACFVVVAKLRTRGGWQWRWGGGE